MAALDPPWMHSLSQAERDEVVAWIRKHGINENLCAFISVDSDGALRAHMYAVDTAGLPEYRDDDFLMDEDIIFRPTIFPDVVAQRLATPDILAGINRPRKAAR